MYYSIKSNIEIIDKGILGKGPDVLYLDSTI